jgi:hypothetical protein
MPGAEPARSRPADHQAGNNPALPTRAVLFDIDGTLVDSNDLHVLAWEAAFASIGLKGADMLVPTLLPDADRATQERLGKLEGEVFQARFRDKAQPFPGAHALLASGMIGTDESASRIPRAAGACHVGGCAPGLRST